MENNSTKKGALQLIVPNKTSKELTTEKSQEEILKAVDEYISSYKQSFVLTIDNYTDVKEENTDNKKLQESISENVKTVIDGESEGINNLKELKKKCLEKLEHHRQKRIKEQEKFLEPIREKCASMLEEYKLEKYEEKLIEQEFQKVEYSKVAIVSNVSQTKKQKENNEYSLKKTARDEVDRQISECLSLQNQTKMRIADLENRCFRAGLKSPLQRSHVENFLFTDDNTYENSINRMIETELKRQKETEERIKKEQEEIKKAIDRGETGVIRRHNTYKEIEEIRKKAEEAEETPREKTENKKNIPDNTPPPPPPSQKTSIGSSGEEYKIVTINLRVKVPPIHRGREDLTRQKAINAINRGIENSSGVMIDG